MGNLNLRKYKLLIIVFILIVSSIVAWLLKTSVVEKRPPLKIGPEKILTPGVTPETIVAEKEPVPVRVFKVKRSDFQDILPAMGTVKGGTEIELRFEMNGIVSSINFREGDMVKRGDIIAVLDQSSALLKLEYTKAKLRASEAAYLTSKKKLEVYEGLYEAGAIIKPKLEEIRFECENVKLQAETVKIEVELAELELSKTSLLAPRDGVIGSRDVEVGESVTFDTRIVSLMDINEVNVEIGIIEKDIDRIRLGQKAVVQVDTYPGIKFWGEIDSIFPVVEGKSRTLTTKVKLSNPQLSLLPGMFARVEIFTVEFKNAIIIPSVSLMRLGPEVTVVPVVSSEPYPSEEVIEGTKPGTVELRNVTVGYATADYTQISYGLDEGELIVVESGGIQLSGGAKVTVIGVEESTL